MTERIDISTLPECVHRAFDGRPSLTFEETAALLGMDPKTLRGHVKAGNISYLAKGLGTARMRREFRLSDVAAFYANISRVEGLSTNVRTRRTTSSTSRSREYDFMDRSKRPPAVAPRR